MVFQRAVRENGKEQPVLEVKKALPFQAIKQHLIDKGVWDEDANVDSHRPKKSNPVASGDW